MDREKKIFYISGAIGIALLILGIVFVCTKGTEMPFFAISIVVLVLSGLTLSFAGIFNPLRRDKKWEEILIIIILQNYILEIRH